MLHRLQVIHGRMGLGQYCTVTRRFSGKKVTGPFYETFEPGTQLVFMRHRGDEDKISVFATFEGVQPDAAIRSDPGSLYEAKRDVFDASTAKTEK